MPPLASVLIALLKNTSVAAAFGVARGHRPDEVFTNNSADERSAIFLIFALGYVVLVEIVSFGAHRLERRWRVAR